MSLYWLSRRAFLAVALLLALAVPALAQVQSGNIFGTVLNQDDSSSIPGVTITLTGAATQVQISDGQGKFRFSGLELVTPWPPVADKTAELLPRGGRSPGRPFVKPANTAATPRDERPLLVVVRKPNAPLTKEELLAYYEGRVAKWQVPDDIAFVDSIPLGATGKMLKTRLREQFSGYRLPTA